jgi:NTP pyrophosphatase (non-canonical NTP hydrolase)
MEMNDLSLQELRNANVSRCNAHFHDINSWSPSDWACALAGEVGELCNLIKKQKRGDSIDVNEMAKEAADILCYLDLLCARMNINLSEITRKKFNEVSERRNCNIRL